MRLDRRAPVYAALAAAGLLVGLAGSLPSATALGAAFLVPLAYGLAARRPVLPSARVEASSLRVLEGDEVEVKVVVTASAALDWLDVELPLPPRLPGGRRQRPPDPFRRTGRGAHARVRVACARGARTPSARSSPADTRSGWSSAPSASGQVIRVYPRVERPRRVVAPLATRPASGNRARASPATASSSRRHASSVPATASRRINWRASARRGSCSFGPLPSELEMACSSTRSRAQTEEVSTLDFSVRAAAALVSAYLPRRDRVGLLAFGAELQWVPPSGGARQQYRIVDAVLASESSRFYRPRDPRLIPRRILPPQSLVVALTPLPTGA